MDNSTQPAAQETSKTSLPPRRRWWVYVIAAVVLCLNAAIVVYLLGSGSDPDMYDHFSNPLYLGRFDPQLWQHEDTQSGSASQGFRGLTLRVEKDGTSSNLWALGWRDFILNSPMFFEVRMHLEQDALEGEAGFLLENSQRGQIGCGLHKGGEVEKSFCFFPDASGQPVRLEEIGFPGQWHVLRLEIDPVSGKASFWVDGAELRSESSPSTNLLSGSPFSLKLYLVQLVDPGIRFLATYNYVRIGSLSFSQME